MVVELQPDDWLIKVPLEEITVLLVVTVVELESDPVELEVLPAAAPVSEE